MRALGSAILGVLIGLFVAGGMTASGVGHFADIDLLNPTTSAAAARRTYAEVAQQEALFKIELEERQRLKEIRLENERLRLEEERAREQQRFENEILLMWAAFGVGAAVVIVLAGAGAFYLITQARVYSQAASPVPHPAHRAPARVASLRASNGNGSGGSRAAEMIGLRRVKPMAP